MLNSEDQCNICLTCDFPLVQANKRDTNGINWCVKLTSCVPEVVWTDESFICSSCTGQLDIAYNFRNLCLNLLTYMKQVTVLPTKELQSDIKSTNLKQQGVLKLNNIDSSNWKYSCPFCNRKFPVKANLDKHLKMHPKRDYKCFQCGKTFVQKISLVKHIQIHLKHICKSCNKQFITESEWKKHSCEILNSPKKQRIKCLLCERTFKSTLAVKQHMSRGHKVNSVDTNNSKSINDNGIMDNDRTNGADHMSDFCDRSLILNDSISTLNDHTCDSNSDLNCSSIDFNNDHASDENDLATIKTTDGKTGDCDLTVGEPTFYFMKTNDGQLQTIEGQLQMNECANDINNTIVSRLRNGKQEKLEKKVKGVIKPIRQTVFTCEICKIVVNSGKKLLAHAVKEHGIDRKLVKPYSCDKCDSKFSTSSNLLQHKKYHMGKRTNICSYCGKGYITKSDLNTHEKQHLNKREYKCETCPKSFNTYKDLRSHKLVVHTDPSTWNYVCSFCEKRFPIKSNRDQHMRRHTGEKRFGCHICEKRFVDKIVLQKHIKSHSNVRAYKCEQCEREYKDKKILEIHLTKIHGIGNAKIPVRVKKYFCHICPKSYFAKNKLTRHVFSHSGEKPFFCHICEKKFTDKSYVKQHLKTAHNVVEADQNKYKF